MGIKRSALPTDADLPRTKRAWDASLPYSLRRDARNGAKPQQALSEAVTALEWRWPKKPIIFIADPHADPEAFVASLLASGGVKRADKQGQTLQLTKRGKQALFLIGGDCFDKGPSNLGLLRVIRQLLDLKAQVKILAGNHDVRLLLGMSTVGHTGDPMSGHFFVRLGHKVAPLLAELCREHLDPKRPLRGIPSEAKCRKKLYPKAGWEASFRRFSSGLLPQHAAEREIKRLHKRWRRFETACQEHGLSLRQVYAASLAWRRLFLEPDGEFHWYMQQLQLAHRAGSLLFLHAGINDRIACQAGPKLHKRLNKAFRKQLEQNPFHLYFGPLGGLIRTKYRRHDWPLSEQGVAALHKSGISALVHGHRNLRHGQRIMLRRGLINFECDCSLDRNTRTEEGLAGTGVAVTIIHPSGTIHGMSSDAACIKVFNPATLQRPASKRENTSKK